MQHEEVTTVGFALPTLDLTCFNHSKMENLTTKMRVDVGLQLENHQHLWIFAIFKERTHQHRIQPGIARDFISIQKEPGMGFAFLKDQGMDLIIKITAAAEIPQVPAGPARNRGGRCVCWPGTGRFGRSVGAVELKQRKHVMRRPDATLRAHDEFRKTCYAVMAFPSSVKAEKGLGRSMLEMHPCCFTASYVS